MVPRWGQGRCEAPETPNAARHHRSHRRRGRRRRGQEEGPTGRPVILADSSFFIALADAKDKWHSGARKLRPRLARGVVISDLAMAEAITVIGARKGGKAAALLGEYFVDNCRLEFLDASSLPE